MIVVVGATGPVGRAVCANLHRAGHQVRAVSRTPSSARAVLPPVDVVAADLEDPGSVRDAVEGADAVLVLSPHSPRQHALQARLVDVAVAVGVPRLVKLSALDAAVRPDSPSQVGRLHWRTEQHLRRHDVAWTVVRPTPFMQNTLEWLGSAVRLGRLLLPMGRAPVALVDARDVGAVLAAALCQPGHEGRTYTVTGPEDLRLDDVAAMLGRARGRRLGYLPVPARLAAAAQRRQGVDPWLVDHQVALAGLVARGAAAVVTTTVADVTGRPARSFAQFLGDEVAAPALSAPGPAQRG